MVKDSWAYGIAQDYTQLKLPNGKYAYSSEYDPNTNQVVPLGYKVCVWWCIPGGGLLPRCANFFRQTPSAQPGPFSLMEIC